LETLTELIEEKALNAWKPERVARTRTRNLCRGHRPRAQTAWGLPRGRLFRQRRCWCQFATKILRFWHCVHPVADSRI